MTTDPLLAALERTVRDIAEAISRTDANVLRELLSLAEAHDRAYRHPRQILHNGRKPR